MGATSKSGLPFSRVSTVPTQQESVFRVDTSTTASTPLSAQEAAYELDATFSPELDLPFEPTVVTPATPQRATPRDPQTGRFAPEPKAPGHDPAVLRLARELGFPEDEITQTPPDVFGERVYQTNRRQLELLALERKLLGAGGQLQPQDQGSQPVTLQGQEPDELDLDPSEYDPKLVAMSKTLKEVRGQLKAREAADAQKAQSEQVSKEVARIDSAFQKAGLEKLFGKGSGAELASSSPEMARRRAVLTQAGALTPGKEAAQIRAASELLFGAQQPGRPSERGNPYADPNGGTEIERRRQVWDEEGPVAVPSHRKPGPYSPETRATLAVHEELQKMAQQGFYAGDDDGEP